MTDPMLLAKQDWLRVAVFGGLGALLLTAPLAAGGAFDGPEDAGVLVATLLLPVLVTLAVALAGTTERARIRRVRRRLEALQRLHGEGLLRDGEYEERRSAALVAL